MKFNKVIPELSVSNIDKAKEFYVEKIGFKIEHEREEDKVVFISLDGCQLMLQQVNETWNVGKLEYPFGRGINLEMTVNGVSAMYV